MFGKWGIYSRMWWRWLIPVMNEDSIVAPVPTIAQMEQCTGRSHQIKRPGLRGRGSRRSSMRQLGSPGSLVSAVVLQHQTRIGGSTISWMDSRHLLRSGVHLDMFVFIRTVVGSTWYGCARGWYGLGPHHLRNCSSEPWNLTVQVHHLSGHWTHCSFYTAEGNHELILFLPQIKGFIG